ncbi:RpiB/LacA/LacB family sugar-phosphate isomerase [Candidatus Micrarchaeota archaeon]|nr:RpiB/LacA/LacB family sugar-phosphate isomerase [Candidatus Micrarchaeota archaeon]MBI5176545.1 RpiB/LacA/LacB family sugar-phosphate isomerase [Candidatus Micrarchaeota archaeon]
MLYLASDHAAFGLKGELEKELDAMGVKYDDLGVHGGGRKADYPEFVGKAASKVSANPKSDRAIVMCGTGMGACIAANKYPHVRAALIYNDGTAALAREHNDANIACFGGREQDGRDVKRWVRIFLQTPFSGDERHVRRIAQIEESERNARR